MLRIPSLPLRYNIFMSYPRMYSVEGIVIKRRNVGEADRILTVFTKEKGKINAIAKGIRRIASRRAGHVEVFSHVRLMIHKGKIWDIVTEASSLDRFERESLAHVSAAYYLCELIDKLTPEEEPNAYLFHLLHESLAAVLRQQTDQVRINIVHIFALELLWTLGFLPRSRQLSFTLVNPFIEKIIEKKIRSLRLLSQMG